MLVAVVATVTLDRGLDPWFTGSIKAIMSNTVEIATAYRDSQCRTIARETNLMAADLDRARHRVGAARERMTGPTMLRSDRARAALR